MNDTSLQLTIRGLDPETKKTLESRAHNEGLSLNRYVLKTLKRDAGVDESESRYLALKQFLNKHHMTKEDKKAFDEALAWSDESSKRKQKQDEA